MPAEKRGGRPFRSWCDRNVSGNNFPAGPMKRKKTPTVSSEILRRKRSLGGIVTKRNGIVDYGALQHHPKKRGFRSRN